MLYALLFIFGLLIGSFINVIALRYDGDHMVADPKVIGGRSHCPHCMKTLQWYELIPVVSFIIQGRRCRNCKATIGWQYPVVEVISGCIFAFVPMHVLTLTGPGQAFTIFSIFWTIVFEVLLLVAYIDIRLGIIPDELNVVLGVLGIFLAIFLAGYYGLGNHSLFGPFGGWFGLQGNIWTNHIFAAFIGAAFFGLLILITRGKGMGMGDVKLAIPLGIVFGWPDILFIIVSAFILGALAGVIFIIRGEKTMKGSLPFAPFLVAGAVIVFFGAVQITRAYLGLLM